MKKAIKILALATAMCAILAISAVAADFEHCADAMNGLGLFRGTQNGYELDREPTRAEAATMLVRLLGAEEEALALTYTAPYTDVEDWAKPYVQYLQDKGLTKGTSATTFGYSEKCTAQQYATFLLRALGYSDSVDGDFTYAEAMKFAKDKGVVDGMNCSESLFLRDHVAAMTIPRLLRLLNREKQIFSQSLLQAVRLRMQREWMSFLQITGHSMQSLEALRRQQSFLLMWR